MADWTDDEIGLAACAIADSFYGGWLNLTTPMRDSVTNMARIALSAVRRVPEGCWIAPDEPTEAMIKAAVQASGFDEAKNAVKVLENAGVLNVVAFKWTGDIEYRAMRDAHKGSKADG